MVRKRISVAFVILAFLAVIEAHPAIQHNFNKIINADKCLKGCMDFVASSGLELSLLKRANISSYFTEIDQVCSTIDQARECFSKCNTSNPYALPSLTTLCEKDARLQIQLLQKCMKNEGDTSYESCRDSCGDYDATNDKVHEMTMAMSSNPHDAEKAGAVMDKTNEACGQLKCVYRCQVAQFNDGCDALFDGHKAGDLVIDLVNRVLVAQRVDLDKHGLTDVVAHQVGQECNYMYMPEVMFDANKDELSGTVITELKQAYHESINGKPTVTTTPFPETLEKVKHHAHAEISYSMAQLQTRLLQRQFHNLVEQELNLQKENEKLDLEIEYLMKRRRALGF